MSQNIIADSHIFQRKILTFLNKTNVKRHNDINVKTIKQMNIKINYPDLCSWQKEICTLLSI